MIRGMMMSLCKSRHRHHQCKYIMSFSHFNFECMCGVESTRETINQRISFITQPICHFSDINLESIVCVCTMHTFAFFSAAAYSVAISKITLLNYWTIVIKGLVKCEKSTTAYTQRETRIVAIFQWVLVRFVGWFFLSFHTLLEELS